MTCRVRSGLPCGAWPAIAAPAAYWLKPPGPTAIPPGSARLSGLCSKTCPKPFATSPGKRKSGCVSHCHRLSSAGINLPVVKARDRNLPMGDRPRGRTSVNRTSHLTAAQGGGRSHGAELPCGQAAAQQTAAQRRLLDRGKPRNEDTEDGNQSADKSLINRRLKLRPQACAVLALPRAGRDLAAAPANYCFILDHGHKTNLPHGPPPGGRSGSAYEGLGV